MVLGADWTFGDFLLGVLYVFAWVILFWLVITVFVDVLYAVLNPRLRTL